MIMVTDSDGTPHHYDKVVHGWTIPNKMYAGGSSDFSGRHPDRAILVWPETAVETSIGGSALDLSDMEAELNTNVQAYYAGIQFVQSTPHKGGIPYGADYHWRNVMKIKTETDTFMVKDGCYVPVHVMLPAWRGRNCGNSVQWSIYGYQNGAWARLRGGTENVYWNQTYTVQHSYTYNGQDVRITGGGYNWNYVCENPVEIIGGNTWTFFPTGIPLKFVMSISYWTGSTYYNNQLTFDSNTETRFNRVVRAFSFLSDFKLVANPDCIIWNPPLITVPGE